MIEQENYLGALSAFKEAYKLRPKETILFNIGMCYKALYRYVEAIETFKQCLSDATKRPEIKQKAKEAIRVLEGLVGKVRLTDAPTAAQVLLNGKKIGMTPFAEPLLVNPGQHSLWVGKKGYKTLRTDITVVSGAELSVRAALKRIGSRLHVECAQAQAVVKIDRKVKGGCPFQGEIEPGEHEVEVSAPDRESFSKTIEVQPGGEVVVTVGNLEVITTLSTNGDDSYAFLISGIAIGAVGLGVLIGVGGYFTIKYNDDFDEIERLTAESDINSDDRARYNDLKGEISQDETVMIASYVVGGVLAVTSIVLLTLHFSQPSESSENLTQGVETYFSETPTLAISPSGIRVYF